MKRVLALSGLVAGAAVLVGVFVLDLARREYAEEWCERSSADREGAEKGPEFIPTSEFQRIQPGQVLPPGLHIRMNLETGEREAKLLDTKSPVEVFPLVWKGGSLNQSPSTDRSDDISNDDEERRIIAGEFASLKWNQDIVEAYQAARHSLQKTLENELGADEEQLEQHLEEILECSGRLEIGLEIVSSDDFALFEGIIRSPHHLSPKIRRLAGMVLGTALSNNSFAKAAALRKGLLDNVLSALQAETDTSVTATLVSTLSSFVRGSRMCLRVFSSMDGLRLILLLAESFKNTHTVLHRLITFVKALLADVTDNFRHGGIIPARRLFQGFSRSDQHYLISHCWNNRSFYDSVLLLTLRFLETVALHSPHTIRHTLSHELQELTEHFNNSIGKRTIVDQLYAELILRKLNRYTTTP